MNSIEPIKLYLDSSDYSVLSDPRVLTTETRAIRDQLLEWTSTNAVVVFFSQALLAEMAPTSQGHESASQARAELLYALCGRHTFFSQDRLIALELASLTDDAHMRPSPYSSEGVWYPAGVDALPEPFTSTELVEEAHREVGSMGLNRAQRRKATRTIQRNQASLHRLVKRQGGALEVSERQAKEVLSGYPLKPCELTLVIHYLTIGKSLAEAQAAYRRSLCDPLWILDWMYTDIERSQVFAAMIRESGQELFKLMSAGLTTADQMRSIALPSVAVDHLSKHTLSQQQIDSIQQIASTLAQKAIGYQAALTVDQLRDRCPGLYAMLGTYFSAWHASVEHNRKAPTPSDYGDALHALYAPYVDVFRADSSMAEHVNKHVRSSTTVVQKLKQLVPTIEQLWSDRQ